MKHTRTGHRFVFVVGLTLLVTSCSFRNPNARKRQYVARGQKYLAAGKLQEAQIEFQNALQIDPRFAEADYELALTYKRLGNVGGGGPGYVGCGHARSVEWPRSAWARRSAHREAAKDPTGRSNREETARN